MNRKIIPVMLCFFAMGFVDLVGIASNYIKGVQSQKIAATIKHFCCNNKTFWCNCVFFCSVEMNGHTVVGTVSESVITDRSDTIGYR